MKNTKKELLINILTIGTIAIALTGCTTTDSSTSHTVNSTVSQESKITSSTDETVSESFSTSNENSRIFNYTLGQELNIVIDNEDEIWVISKIEKENDMFTMYASVTNKTVGPATIYDIGEPAFYDKNTSMYTTTEDYIISDDGSWIPLVDENGVCQTIDENETKQLIFRIESDIIDVEYIRIEADGGVVILKECAE